MQNAEYKIRFFNSMVSWGDYSKKMPVKYAETMVRVFGWKFGTGASNRNNGISTKMIYKPSKANKL